MLPACNAAAPTDAADGGAAAEGEEHGEYEEAPLETKIAAKAAQAAGIQVAPAGPGHGTLPRTGPLRACGRG
ncbi:hypothetical protein G6F32_017288 [Rhizopus arrhizus]|nr:hypothetical protein G6F32_017288 [Rhizopus arrhizus]